MNDTKGNAKEQLRAEQEARQNAFMAAVQKLQEEFRVVVTIHEQVNIVNGLKSHAYVLGCRAVD